MLSPIDADGLGTWIAVTGPGLAWALMNLNRDGTRLPQTPRVSRGQIIPMLAEAADLARARQLFAGLPLHRFAPFRLLAVDGDERSIWEWNGERASFDRRPLRDPEIFCSSSLGDDQVEAPRRALFRALLAEHSDPWRAQDQLHQHTWPDRRHISVLMSRPDAATVSRTVVVLTPMVASLSYAPIWDGWIGPVVHTTLELRSRPLALSA
jgi:hypothetical protein